MRACLAAMTRQRAGLGILGVVGPGDLIVGRRRGLVPGQAENDAVDAAPLLRRLHPLHAILDLALLCFVNGEVVPVESLSSCGSVGSPDVLPGVGRKLILDTFVICSHCVLL